MALNNDSVEIVIFVISIIAIILNLISIVFKLCKDFTNPKLWKYALLYQDIAFICLSAGLLQFCVNLFVDVKQLCDATGFSLLFGIFQCLLSYLTTGVILLSIQNPGKSSSISSFHRNLFIVIVLPEIVIGATLSFLPYVSDKLFNTDVDFDVACFPIRDHGKQGSSYGTLIVVLWWLILVAVVTSDVILVLKLWKFHNRVNSAQNNVWQTQRIYQGKTLVKLSIFEHILLLLLILITTVSIYTDLSFFKSNNTWIVMTSLAVSAILHGILSNIGDVMWTTCCCRDNSAVKEPHRKLKKLELLQVEAPGKLRMKATWTLGKHVTKRGLMKVYGMKHLKSWAQEIVILGMLRRVQHPSLIQCLWTSSSNPYYETMTLISGEIITSDSRIICLELTNGGTLDDFLQKTELPLPEQCQRMIIHDIAEGLFYLHHENILHCNLTTSCIYLKGSLQTKFHRKKSMVLRAAVGDFEQAQIYGTLQQSLDSSIKDKRYFFLPDIRSFSLIALEIVAKMCEKKFQNRYVNYSSDQVPLRLNLSTVISDEDDEFEAQYCYDVEDTHRMFHAVHDDEEYESEDNMDGFDAGRKCEGSLANLIDASRPMSPAYEARNSRTPDTLYNSTSDSETDIRQSNKPDKVSFSKNEPKQTMSAKPDHKRFETPDSDISKASSRKNKQSEKKKSGNAGQYRSNHALARSVSPNYSMAKQENGRCASPDPMKDEMIQEMRKETKSGGKSSRKDMKFSFNRKRSEEDVFQKSKVEAFVKTGAEQPNKRKDANWLAKPSSILKSFTSNDTTVSVFKAKPNDEESHLDAIEEEDIHQGQSSNTKPRQVKVKEAKQGKAEVWDIIDEQYYTQVNRKAMHNLKKTISGESRSSLWSFISTPEDLDDDDLDDILDCLPGMTEPSEFRKPEITVSEIMAEKDKSMRNEQSKRKFNLSDLSKSKFELIDYYEMLKSKQITINDVPEDKREMLLNVVEFKLEEKMRREGTNGGSVIRSDEMYDHNMNPGSANNDKNNNQKVKIISFRTGQCHSSPHRNPNTPIQERDPRLDRARSAPLKRPRTPMHKPPQERPPEVNPVFQDTKSVTIAKRNKARAALRKAITKDRQSYSRVISERPVKSENMPVKYAKVKKINSTDAVNGDVDNNPEVVLTVPVPTSESFSVTTVKPKLANVKRYPSFSSNESASSVGSHIRQRPADVSLTSGELSSLSSQAESDHYETDFHMTDVEMTHSAHERKNKIKAPSSRVDSGFDSGSMSSEMSDAFTNRNLHLIQSAQQGSNNGLVNSWARNYKIVDSVSDSPYNFAQKFLPPVDSLPEESSGENKLSEQNVVNPDKLRPMNDSDSGISAAMPSSQSSDNRQRPSRSRKRANPRNQKDLKAFNFSPYTTVSSRPIPLEHRSFSPPSRVMSPAGRALSPPSRSVPSHNSRPMSPNLKDSPYNSAISDRKLMSPKERHSPPKDRPFSPKGRPFSPKGRPTTPKTQSILLSNRPMSPPNRPMSPNVLPTENRAISRLKNAQQRPMSPRRSFSPTPVSHRQYSNSRPFSPGRKLARPPSPPKQKSFENSDHPEIPPDVNVELPQMSDTASVAESSASKASKRYRALVKQGVPLRTSVIDASPTRQDSTAEELPPRPNTTESMLEEPPDDQNLFENLDAKGFFTTKPRSRSPSPHKTLSPVRGRSPVGGHSREGRSGDRRKKPIPLEEIIRETPANCPKKTPHRSASKNHLAVSEDAYLNQPTSEDSETCSIKTNKSNTSTPSGSKPKVMVDAELVIDRIFSQNQQENQELDVEVEAALGLDKDPFKAINDMYLNNEHQEFSDLNDIPLLNGVNQHHVQECQALVSSMHVVTIHDLLPAKHESFDVLHKKLQQVGQLGNVGNQLLEVIRKCWLQDMPPTSGDIVEQLTDPVTETEL